MAMQLLVGLSGQRPPDITRPLKLQAALLSFSVWTRYSKSLFLMRFLWDDFVILLHCWVLCDVLFVIWCLLFVLFSRERPCPTSASTSMILIVMDNSPNIITQFFGTPCWATWGLLSLSLHLILYMLCWSIVELYFYFSLLLHGTHCSCWDVPTLHFAEYLIHRYQVYSVYSVAVSGCDSQHYNTWCLATVAVTATYLHRIWHQTFLLQIWRLVWN